MSPVTFVSNQINSWQNNQNEGESEKISGQETDYCIYSDKSNKWHVPFHKDMTNVRILSRRISCGQMTFVSGRCSTWNLAKNFAVKFVKGRKWMWLFMKYLSMYMWSP